MKFWIKALLLAAAAVALLLYLFPTFGAVKVSLTPQTYHFNLNLGWTPMTNSVLGYADVAGYYVYCNGVQYVQDGRGSTGTTISNLTGPGKYVLTARTYALSGAESDMSDYIEYDAPIQTWKISCNSTGYVVQSTLDFKSWVSISSSTVTNSGTKFYRATSKWP